MRFFEWKILPKIWKMSQLSRKYELSGEQSKPKLNYQFLVISSVTLVPKSFFVQGLQKFYFIYA